MLLDYDQQNIWIIWKEQAVEHIFSYVNDPLVDPRWDYRQKPPKEFLSLVLPCTTLQSV